MFLKSLCQTVQLKIQIKFLSSVSACAHVLPEGFDKIHKRDIYLINECSSCGFYEEKPYQEEFRLVYYVTAPQETWKGKLDEHYQPKRELVEITVNQDPIQQPIIITIQGNYTWPEVPRLEVTLLYENGEPCVDHWYEIIPKRNLNGYEVYPNSGTRYRTRSSAGFTNADGKLTYYGISKGT